MKKFIAAFLLIFLPIIASADDELSPKLVGTWWGTMTTIPPAKPAGNGHWVCVNQHVWVIQRTTDGRYRKQGFRVDNELKVYCVASSSSGVGSWRVSGKNLLTHQFDEGSTGTDQVSVLEGRINWTGGSMSGPEVKWECQEVSIPKFESKIDSSYRRLSIHEFNDRYLKQSGHKGVDKSAIAPDSKPEGDKK